MQNLRDITDDNARINYGNLMSYLLTKTLTDFLDEVKHPLLVGKQLYEGDLRAPKIATKKVAQFIHPSDGWNVRKGGIGVEENTVFLFVSF